MAKGNKYYCPDCGSYFEQGDSNYDYDSGITHYECRECGWTGTHDEVKEDEDMVVEWCPHCEEEVWLDPVLCLQTCPSCGKHIVPCSICEDMHCSNCKLAESCESLNEAKFTKYEPKDLKQILETCASYVENTDDESIKDYFREFIQSGLFHDAMGKPAYIRHRATHIEVVTEY